MKVLSKRDRDIARTEARHRAADVDMNPMVDLAFLLLTFFMLTTTFTRDQIMELLMPNPTENQQDQTPVKASKALHLLLDGEGQLFWYRGARPEGPMNQFRHRPEELRRFLQEQVLPESGMVLLIKPSDRSRYGLLVDVLDDLHATDAPRYAITALSPDDQRALEKQRTDS